MIKGKKKNGVRVNTWLLLLLTVVIPLVTLLGAQNLYFSNKIVVSEVPVEFGHLANVDLRDSVTLLFNIGAVATIASFIVTIVYWNHNRA